MFTSETTKFAPCINRKIADGTEWASLTEQEVELFNQRVICRKYSPGEIVFMEGDPCKGMYFVEGGLVGVRKIDWEGNFSLVRLAKRGDTLGYRPLLANQNHRAGAQVVEDAKICFIDGDTIRQILQNNHELSLKFLQHTAQALGEAEDRLFKMTALRVEVRVIHLLLLFHDQWGCHQKDGSVTIKLPITRVDFASMIGAHPDSLSRAIRHLEEEGHIEVEGRAIKIEHFDRLAEQLHTDLIHSHKT